MTHNTTGRNTAGNKGFRSMGLGVFNFVSNSMFIFHYSLAEPC